MKLKQTLIIFLIVSLMAPSGFSIPTSGEINIQVPDFMNLVSFNSKFDSAYPKQDLTFDLSVNILESEEGMMLKDLASSDYKLEITDENGKRITFWNEIREEAYQISSKYSSVAETQPITGYIQRGSKKYPFYYLWEMSRNPDGQTAKLKIASNSKNYYVLADDKIILESPHIKIPYDSALGGSFNVSFSNEESGEDRNLGEFSFSVANKSDVAKAIVVKSLYALGLVGILLLIAGAKRDEIQNAIIVSIIVPVVYFAIVYSSI